MSSLQLTLLFFFFIWSGFVRTGFGFGANTLLLPLALLIVPNPLIIVPVVALQSFCFGGFEVAHNFQKIAWREIGKMSLVLVPTFAAGVYGLINFPAKTLTLMVYGVTIFYALLYIRHGEKDERKIVSSKRHQIFFGEILDFGSLVLGGYVSGISMIGGPMIVAVAAKKIPRALLKNTLLMLWVFTGFFKTSAFLLAGVSLQWTLQTVTLPAVALGHFLGLKFHDRIAQSPQFYRWIGVMLLAVCVAGIWQAV
jgi:hypothetical protein